MPYCDVREVLNMLWVSCTRGEGGAEVGGSVKWWDGYGEGCLDCWDG